MSNKKSYMNQSNLITEGFFDKLKSLLGLDSKKVKLNLVFLQVRKKN